MRTFSFGRNWLAYSTGVLSQSKIAEARADFYSLLEGIPLEGKLFLDIGFGQGLALLLATEQGAKAVGIDLDPDCVRAYNQSAKFFAHQRQIQTFTGSILDPSMVRSLLESGPFDVVHSWGVLHHTGNMAQAIANAACLVKPGGAFVLAIYNRHWTAPIWKLLKFAYYHSPAALQGLILALLAIPALLRSKYLTWRNPNAPTRGMSWLVDLKDWLGGYPYEYGSVAEIEAILAAKGFSTIRIIATQGFTGCNQFVLRKE